MSYPIKYPTPQSANVQIFNYATSDTGVARATEADSTWIKPQGASFVYFCLIGPGGAGGQGDSGIPINGAGGGSGAVTNFMCPAFLIPDSLVVKVGKGSPPYGGSSTTQIGYRQKSGTFYELLVANIGSDGGSSGGAGGGGGTPMSSNYFTAIGFLNSTAGQTGADPGFSISVSSTTFLSGGSSSNDGVPANYGYTTSTGQNFVGYFQTQPIIVGAGAQAQSNNGAIYTSNVAIGCGGGGGIPSNDSVGSSGGNGMVVIITW